MQKSLRSLKKNSRETVSLQAGGILNVELKIVAPGLGEE